MVKEKKKKEKTINSKNNNNINTKLKRNSEETGEMIEVPLKGVVMDADYVEFICDTQQDNHKNLNDMLQQQQELKKLAKPLKLSRKERYYV